MRIGFSSIGRGGGLSQRTVYRKVFDIDQTIYRQITSGCHGKCTGSTGDGANRTLSIGNELTSLSELHIRSLSCYDLIDRFLVPDEEAILRRLIEGQGNVVDSQVVIRTCSDIFTRVDVAETIRVLKRIVSDLIVSFL